MAVGFDDFGMNISLIIILESQLDLPEIPRYSRAVLDGFGIGLFAGSVHAFRKANQI